MKRALLVVALALAAPLIAWSRTHGGQAKRSPLAGTWVLVSGQRLPEEARDVKIISEGHFIFVAYDTKDGKPLSTGGGTYVLNGTSYTEHVEFASDTISAGLVGNDQVFAVTIAGDTFMQTGTFSNGKALSDTWRRLN
jgi:hypothetical protein